MATSVVLIAASWAAVCVLVLAIRHQPVRSLAPQVALPMQKRAGRRRSPAVVAMLGLALVQVELAIVTFLVVRSRVILRRRRITQQRIERSRDALGEVIDMLAVALLSGLTVAQALSQIVDWGADQPGGVDRDPPTDEYSVAFAWCLDQVAEGRSLSVALERLPERIGAHVYPLVSALVATERYGAPIAHSLTALAADVRAERRRGAEAAARRLPVVMLFPLVVCVLPAFLLLTIVPVVAEAVGSFDLSIAR